MPESTPYMFLKRTSSQTSSAAERLALLDHHAGVGLWDAVLHDGDPMHPKSTWIWSGEFRRLLGFSSAAEFPDVVGSWADRLHADDAAATMAAFAACLSDTSGRTSYNVTYRLKMKNSSYRWFRAVGGVARDQSGKATRACGSLIDIEAEKAIEAELRLAMRRLADRFETRVMGLVKTVSSSVGALQATAQTVSAAAQQAGAQTSTVASASDRASANVQTVASAAEELASSIGEISRQVSRAAQVSATAAEEAIRTNTMVEGLARAADRIGEVVSLISSIAGQTNLLALNATIEAARAGDAGKGFAVVAGEVKGLANQTAKATGEISAQISAVQEETRKAVDAIKGIGTVIDQVREISSSIASAVEQQGAATREIAANVQQAAQGTQEVSANIAAATKTIAAAGPGCAQVLSSANDLAANSETLRTEVASFLAEVRAG
jgi:ABC-type transporter Mla subunit MlaD